MEQLAQIPLCEGRYSTPETLNVTRLRKDVLQTWINRNVIELGQQNPGSGRRRLYRAIDVVKLAIMRRMADLKIDLSVSVKIAEAAAARLADGEEFEWDFYIFLRPNSATSYPINLITVGDPLSAYEPTVGDPFDMRVATYVEPFEGIVSRRSKISLAEAAREGVSSDRRSIDPAKRKHLAQQGIHAEPVVIFPLGEIVNGTIEQLKSLEEAGRS